MPSLHQLDSRFGRLTAAEIDRVLEHVRDATEVLFETETLSARDMLVIARDVLACEQLFERDPQAFTEVESAAQGDWTCACMAEGFAHAMEQLQARGALQAAERARAQAALVLQRVADSPTRSPLIDEPRVLRELIQTAQPRRRIELLRRYLAHELRAPKAGDALVALLEIGIAHLALGQHALAFDVFTQVLRHEPTAVAPHAQLAAALQQDFPELACAAAQRALLLAARDTHEALRTELRALIEQTRGRRGTAPYPELLRLLRDKPGKRSRLAVTALCESLVPEIAYVKDKPGEPLPDVAALAQLRRDLRELPLLQTRVQAKLA